MTGWPEKSVVCPVLIGRAASLQALDALMTEARGGSGRTVLIAGEAGIGKSRLVAEAQARLAATGPAARSAERTARVLQGHCFEPDRALPYAPIIDLLRALVGGRAPEEIADWLGPAAGELVKLLPELGAVIPGLAPTPPLEPEAEQRRLFHAVTQFVAGLASRQPLLIVIEDVHWSDDTSLDLLLGLARRLRACPILLLLTYRSDELHPALRHVLAELDRERLATELTLTRLTPGEVDAMLQAIFQLERPARADFLDAVYGLTEGNPFFVEEVLKSLLAAGDIFYAGGTWDRRAMDELHIPRSVDDAVQRRAARLSPDARRVLDLAAVAGRRFDFSLLRELTGSDEAALLRALKELIGAQLVVEASAEQFVFRHALTRRAVYAGLLARERQALHREIARTMERPAAPDARLGDLAHHFFEAGEWAKSLEYARRAGAQAQALHAPRAAAEHFSRAVEASRRLGLPPALDLLRARGLAYETLGEFDRARDDCEEALRLARADGDRPTEWQLLLDLGLLWAGRDYAHAGEHYRAALALARALADPPALARSLNRFGNWLGNVGRTAEAIAAHQEALALIRPGGDERALAETYALLGIANTLHDDQTAAAGSYRQAIDLFRALGDSRGLSQNLAHRGIDLSPAISETGYGLLGTRAESERAASEARQLALQIDWPAGQAFAAWTTAVALAAFGDFGAGLAHAERALRIASEIAHQQWLAAAHWALCQIHLGLLDAEAAVAAGEAALPLARGLGSAWWIGNVTAYVAFAHLLKPDPARAEAALVAAMPRDRGPRNSMERRMAWAWGEMALARGEAATALSSADSLIASTPGQPRDQPIPALLKLKGEALLALDRTDQALLALAEAKRGALLRDARALLWQVQGSLARALAAAGRDAEARREALEAGEVVAGLAATIDDEPVRERFRRAALATLAPFRPLPPPADKPAVGGLTARELEVVRLLSQGKSNREIADALYIGERTVETHVGNILAKLGCSSRAQVAALHLEQQGG